jgi:hypothetical protein
VCHPPSSTVSLTLVGAGPSMHLHTDFVRQFLMPLSILHYGLMLPQSGGSCQAWTGSRSDICPHTCQTLRCMQGSTTGTQT